MNTAADIISSYRARISAEAWAQIGPLVRDVVTAAGSPPQSVRFQLQAVSGLAAWALGVGIDLDPETILHPDTIDRYIACGTTQLADSTRSTRRGALSTIGRRVTRLAPWGPDRPAYTITNPLEPYTESDVAVLLAAAAHQGTAYRRRAMTVILTLGLGAGLRTRELTLAIGRDIHSRDGHTIISVGGPAAREIPILDRYAGTALTLARRYPGPLVRELPISKPNLIATVIGTLEIPESVQPLTVSRLRSTWAVQIFSTVPFPMALAAYGTVRQRFLYRLNEHLSPADLSDPATIATLAKAVSR